MSHTAAYGNVTFIHNGDLATGMVTIRHDDGTELSFPGEDLLAFVGDAFVRPRLIAQLEDAHAIDLLTRMENP